MARMYPSKLTDAFSGFGVPAERTVFEKLARELPDDCHVFHDVAWDDPSLDDSKTAGQIDFVIVRQDYGLIAIEVKGGRCSYDPDRRGWTSIDRHEKSVEISDPFDQAKTASRILMKLLRRQAKLRDMFIPYHYAGAFPDCVLGKRDLRGDVKGWQIVDQESLFDLKSSISNLFEQSFPDGPIVSSQGKLILQGIRDIYGDRALTGKVPVQHKIKAVSDRLVRLTEDQFDILDLLREQKRLLIKGCAGSGKTTLALHKAKMLAEQGKSVLLVCYNQPLGWYLKGECLAHENLTVGDFTGLCFRWLKEINKPIDVVDTDDWWSVTLPTTVADEIDTIPHRYDAIIVDEGQDFVEDYWLTLEMLLDDPKSGILYVFADAGQNIYRGVAELPIDTAPIVLNRNLRNTNQVFDVVKHSCNLPDDVKSSGVDGPKVEFLEYADERGMVKSIVTILSKLVSEHVVPADIAILGTKSQKRTVLKHGTKIGPFQLVEKRSKNDELLTMSVHRFKGLESPVVILCELDEKLTYKINEILYVGLTRATSILFVLKHESAPAIPCGARMG